MSSCGSGRNYKYASPAALLLLRVLQLPDPIQPPSSAMSGSFATPAFTVPAPGYGFTPGPGSVAMDTSAPGYGPLPAPLPAAVPDFTGAPAPAPVESPAIAAALLRHEEPRITNAPYVCNTEDDDTTLAKYALTIIDNACITDKDLSTEKFISTLNETVLGFAVVQFKKYSEQVFVRTFKAKDMDTANHLLHGLYTYVTTHLRYDKDEEGDIIRDTVPGSVPRPAKTVTPYLVMNWDLYVHQTIVKDGFAGEWDMVLNDDIPSYELHEKPAVLLEDPSTPLKAARTDKKRGVRFAATIIKDDKFINVKQLESTEFRSIPLEENAFQTWFATLTSANRDNLQSILQISTTSMDANFKTALLNKLEYIGQGSRAITYGLATCVFSPALQCPATYLRDQAKTYVSQLFVRESDASMQLLRLQRISNLDTLKDGPRFTAKPICVCKVGKRTIPFEYYACDGHSSRPMYQLVLEAGGIPVKEMLALMLADENALAKALFPLFLGMSEMSKKNFYMKTIMQEDEAGNKYNFVYNLDTKTCVFVNGAVSVSNASGHSLDIIEVNSAIKPLINACKLLLRAIYPSKPTRHTLKYHAFLNGLYTRSKTTSTELIAPKMAEEYKTFLEEHE